MHISPSSILAAIESAEHSLGSPIFNRRRATGIQLTPSGDRFVAAGRHLLLAETSFHRQIGVLQTDAQSIRVGCFEPFGPLFMTEAMLDFTREVGPIDVALLEGDQTQLSDWLNRGLVDVVVTYDIGPRFNAHVTPICRVPAHVMVAVDHPLAKRTAVSMTDLEPYSLVLLDLPLTVSYLLSLFDNFGIKPRVSFRSRSYETVRNAVAAGFGVAILNMRPINSVNAEHFGVVRLPILDDLPAPTLQIVDLYGPDKPKTIKRLCDVFQRLFREADSDRFIVATDERRATLFDV